MTTPEEIVAGQLEALNARDIEAFMAFWWEDAQFFQHPARLTANGRDEIRKQISDSFERRNSFVNLISRIALGDRVIDHVNVLETLPQGIVTINVVAIYQIEGEKIRTAWFIVDPPPAAPKMYA